MDIFKTTDKRAIGKKGEALAIFILEEEGYKILERNFRTKLGEIDIIAEDKSNKDLVFIEVRARKNSSFGTAKESIDYRKQKRIVRIALVYIKKNYLRKRNIRFDVFAIQEESYELIKNAFDSRVDYTY